MSRGSRQLDCVYVCLLVRFKVHPFDGGSASPFIEEGVGFYKGEGLGCILYLVLWLTSTWLRSSF